MTGPLYQLGRFCVRHRWIVAALWVALAIALLLGSRSAGSQTSDNISLPGADSQAAADVLKKQFPEQANGMVPISFEAPAGKKLTESAFKNAIVNVTKTYQKDDRLNSAVGPFDSSGSAQLSADQRYGYIALQVKDSSGDLTEDEAHSIFDESAPLDKAGLQPAAGAYLGQKISKQHNEKSEGVGLLAAVVILLLTFGTAVAMGLPILTAIIGLVAGLSIIGLLGHVVDVPTTAPALATMIGLGVGIDYALFVITRHRQQLQEGMACDESIARANATSGGAVVFAGGTVIIALVSLLLAGIPIVTTLGYTSGIVVLVAVLGAIVFMPALLGIVGLGINALKLPSMSQEHDPRPHGWARWARWVAARPWPAVAFSVVVLAVLSAPILQLELGQSNTGALPTDTSARQSYDQMTKGFGVGSNGPILLTVKLTPPAEVEPGQTSPASDERLQDLRNTLMSTKGVQSVTQPLVNKAGTAAVYSVQSKAAPSNEATSQLVHRLRDDVLPEATDGNGVFPNVGGITAGYIDLADSIAKKLPLVIGIVLALSFVLLLLAFRSVVVPLKAVVMNLLSIGAAFGIVTYVFGHDWSANLLGLDGAQPIISYVPLMMFAILFGLSMDYEVFLMTHVRERFMATDDAHEGVVDGLAGTARVITSAALIMVSVFLAFLLSGDPTIKQFGLGMAAAVAIDATLIRCVLVPAVMALLDRRAWWMPQWLDRATPAISIEGEEYFHERDQRDGRVASASSGHQKALDQNLRAMARPGLQLLEYADVQDELAQLGVTRSGLPRPRRRQVGFGDFVHRQSSAPNSMAAVPLRSADPRY
jgi:putative drug exporter of the RND superfamily